MRSTMTSVSFFRPQTFVYVFWSHVSYAGTKWTHWMIRSVFWSSLCRNFGTPATDVFGAAPL